MSSRLRDLALLLLGVLTLALTAHVLTRSPGAQDADDVVAPRASTTSSVRALFIGDEALLEPEPTLPTVVGQALGWDVVVAAAEGSGFVRRGATGTYGDFLPRALRQWQADVVVVLASADPAEVVDGLRYGGNVQLLVSDLRRALPEADVVLVSPLPGDPAAAPLQRQVLTQVAARFGAYFVDVSGRRYLLPPGSVTPDGALTAAGVQRAARGLDVELRRVLPMHLVASPRPSAGVNGG